MNATKQNKKRPSKLKMYDKKVTENTVVLVLAQNKTMF